MLKQCHCGYILEMTSGKSQVYCSRCHANVDQASLSETFNFLLLFELGADSTTAQLDERYRKLCAQWHPDLGGSTTLMKLLNEARDTVELQLKVKPSRRTPPNRRTRPKRSPPPWTPPPPKPPPPPAQPIRPIDGTWEELRVPATIAISGLAGLICIFAISQLTEQRLYGLLGGVTTTLFVASLMLSQLARKLAQLSLALLILIALLGGTYYAGLKIGSTILSVANGFWSMVYNHPVISLIIAYVLKAAYQNAADEKNKKSKG